MSDQDYWPHIHDEPTHHASNYESNPKKTLAGISIFAGLICLAGFLISASVGNPGFEVLWIGIPLLILGYLPYRQKKQPTQNTADQSIQKIASERKMKKIKNHPPQSSQKVEAIPRDQLEKHIKR